MIIDAIRIRNLYEYSEVVLVFSAKCHKGEISYETFCDELDCYRFYWESRLFRKCYKHIYIFYSNNENAIFEDCLSYITSVLEIGDREAITLQNEWPPSIPKSTIMVYLWARKIILNEWLCNYDEDANIMQKMSEVEKRYQNLWHQLLMESLDTEPCKIVCEYARKPLFFLCQLFPPRLANEQAKFFVPDWKPLRTKFLPRFI